MTISPTTQELLKASAGRGVLNDPTLLTKSKVRLLQNTSKMPKHGRGVPGLYLLPDEAQTCAKTLRVISGVLYSVFVERGPDDKFVHEHHVLPRGAEKDEHRWRLSGNVIEKEARLAGVFNSLEAELDLAKTGMKVARALNSDAKARVSKLGLPLYGLAYEFGSQELFNDRGQPYFGPTFAFLGAAGEPDGPSEEEIIRASGLCDVVEATLAEANRQAVQMVEDRKRIEINSGRARSSHCRASRRRSTRTFRFKRSASPSRFSGLLCAVVVPDRDSLRNRRTQGPACPEQPIASLHAREVNEAR
jgi:hypothetical protein